LTAGGRTEGTGELAVSVLVRWWSYRGSIGDMKLSVSLSDSDVAVLDDYVRTAGLPSRSAAVQRAVRLLRYPDLEKNYEQAWDEWAASGDSAVWELTVADGLDDAPR